MKLFHMLEHLEAVGYSNIASFQPHGRAVRIHDQRRFQADILPRYFPDNKNVGSFQRQLNIYGFRRMINSGPDRDSYYHAMFLRGRPDLCSLIERPSKSQHSKRKKYDPMTEPNFYIMPPIQLLPTGCPQISDPFPHIEQSAEGTEASDSKFPSTSQRNLPEGTSDNDVQALNYQLDVLPEIKNESHSRSINDINVFSKAPSFASAYIDGSTSTIYHEANDQSQNKSIRSGSSSDAAFVNFMSSRNTSENTIASDIYPRTSIKSDSGTAYSSTSNIHNSSNTIPENVVAAAASLLETQHEPRIPIDSSSSIVDQYCLNLATNILKESCYTYTEPSPSNTKGDVQQNKRRRRANRLKADEIDCNIPPISMKSPANDAIVHRDVDALKGNDVDSQHDSDGSSRSSGFDMAQFLDHANLDSSDPFQS
jgi:hypothetical protein